MSLMLFFRQHMKVIFVITIVGFVVATFAGFGGYYVSKKRNSVAVVNGDRIPGEEFNRLYSTVLMNEEKEKKLTDDDRKKLRNQVIQMLLQQRILLQQACKFGLKVTDPEVASIITTYPLFQNEGRFDRSLYHKNLRYVLRQSPEEFEKNTRKELLTEKIKALVAGSTKISEAEVKFEYERIKEGSIKQFAKEKVSFEQEYFSHKRMMLLNNWFRGIADKAKVEVYLKD